MSGSDSRIVCSSRPTIIDAAEAQDERSYIFAPSLVYGTGEGFGNNTSKDAAIVKAAKKLRRVYEVDTDNPAHRYSFEMSSEAKRPRSGLSATLPTRRTCFFTS